MTDIELRLSADVGQAVKGIGSFRKEYAELVKAIEKPLRQIDALQSTQESAKKAAAEFFAAKEKVASLQQALEKVNPSALKLGQAFAQAEKEMTRASAAVDRQKQKLEAQRGAVLATKQALDSLKQAQAGVDNAAKSKGDTAAMVAAKQAVAAATAEYEKQRTVLVAHQQTLAANRAGVKVLGDEYQAAAQPVRILEKELGLAERNLAGTTREFDRQKAKVREQRAELKAAGVDYRNLAAEQQRLQGALGGALGKGNADAAVTKALDTFGVTKLRELRSQLTALKSDYARLTQAGVLSASERASAEIAYRARINQTTAAIREATAASNVPAGVGLSDIAARLAGIVAAAYSVQRVAGAFFSIADEVNTLEDRMRGALPVTAEYERAQERLEEISRRVRIPLAQTSELFLRSVAPLREMGFSARTTADMVAVLSAGLVTSNVKGEQAVAVINQLSKGLQTGKIRGDAFNAMLENAPTLIDALTKGLGVSRSELIRMAAAGELTTERFVAALSQQSEALLGLADGMRNTVGDAQSTFSDSIGKVVGSIDALLGISDKAVKQLDKLSDALNAAAEGNGRAGLDALTQVGSTTGLAGIQGLSILYQAYAKWRGDVVEVIDDVTAAEKRGRDAAEATQERRLSEMRTYAAEFNDIQKGLAVSFKDALDSQVAAQRKASSALSKARSEQLSTEKRYKDALDALRVGAQGPASFGNAQALQLAARQALAAKDVEGAKRNAQAALKTLTELAAAGENTYGFAGFIKSLQGIEQEADKISVKNAETSLEAAKQKTREWKAEFEELKNFKIEPGIDDAALAKATEKMRSWAQMIGKELKIDPRQLTQDPLMQPGSKDAEGYVLINNPPPVPTDIIIKDVVFPGDEKPIVDAVLKPSLDPLTVPPVEVSTEVNEQSAVAVTEQLVALVERLKSLSVVPIQFIATEPDTAAGTGGGGFAGGGWTGPGSKYQPAGVVHADEHVQPKRVVNEPGALPFLEQIRRNGFRNTISQLKASMASGLSGYAEGGYVSERSLPAIPAMNPALLEGAVPRDFGRVAFEFGGGDEFSVYASQRDALNIQRLARKFGHKK